MRKRIKRGGALLLALTLALTPVTLQAEEGVPEQTEKSLAGTEEGQFSADVNTADSKETSQTESVKETPQAETGSAGTEDPANTTQADGEDEQYDVTKPVIEKVEFPQNGKTLTQEDTLELLVYAKDMESGINRAEAYVYFQDEDGNGTSYSMDSSYDEERDCYVLTCPLKGIRAVSGYVGSLSVVDNRDNYASWTVSDNTGYLYTFDLAREEDPVIPVQNLKLDRNQATVKAGDKVTFTFEVDVPDSITDARMLEVEIENEKGTHSWSMQANLQKTGEYSVSFDIDSYMTNGKWMLSEVELLTESGTIPLVLEGQEDIWFEVTGNDDVKEDTEAPKITSIEVDKNGEILEAGDSVTIRVKAEDNVGINTSNASLSMYAAADIADGSYYIDLEWNEEEQVFEGVFEVTEDTYPCEWYIGNVDIYDTSGNEAPVNEIGPNVGATYPWYVQVTNGSTFVNPTYTVNISFMTLDANGRWQETERVTKENVERRTTLEEAGISLPEYSSNYEGIQQIGWQTSMGREVTSDMQVVENLGYLYVYAKYDKLPVYLSYRYVNADGEEAYEREEAPILMSGDATYSDVETYLKDIPAPEDSYEGLEFQKWEITSYYQDADEPLMTSNNISVSASYDKNLGIVSFGYLDNKDEWKHITRVYPVEKGSTYGDVIKQAESFRPDDASDEIELTGWTVDEYAGSITEEVMDSYGYINLEGDYGDKCVVMGTRIYYTEEGYQTEDSDTYIVDKGTSYQEIYDKMEALDMPKMYPGLDFESWDSSYDGEIEVSGARITSYAIYKQAMIRMLIDPKFEDLDGAGMGPEEEVEFIKCFVVDRGDEITLPSSFEGYENVTWLNYPEGGKVTGDYDRTFYGYVPGGSTQPEDPDEPTEPEDPDEPTQPEEPEQPDNPSTPEQEEGTKLPESAVSGIITAIESTDEGEDISVDMGSATVISKEILEAAQGKDVDIKLNMGGYTWTINGQDIKASNLKDINLKVDVNTNAVPSSVVKKLAGGNPTMQLSLAHEGDFGFLAELSLNVGSDKAGKYGNLFYYDSDGKMVYIDAGVVTADGMLSLTFSHASEYVVVFNEKQMSQSDVPSDLQPLSGGGADNAAQAGGAARTGDEAPAGMMIAFMAAALAVIAVLVIRRKHSVK